MKLLRFRVTNFRSVEDSGWIDTGDITALIGENESGKTNLLTPLWKLNPANREPINLLNDAPRHLYPSFRKMEQKPIFIEARFLLTEELAKEIAQLTKVDSSEVNEVEVKRNFDEDYYIEFPNVKQKHSIAKQTIEDIVLTTKKEVANIETKIASDGTFQNAVIDALNNVTTILTSIDSDINSKQLTDIIKTLNISTQAPQRSRVKPHFEEICENLNNHLASITIPHPNSNDAATDIILDRLPSFVYYSDYGNLDTEIYLPHVIANMERTDLGLKEQAKARTLKVLFGFVGLEPQEILELGREELSHGEPTGIEIEKSAQQKKEREVLLQAASGLLTKEFRDWWKQGDYTFQFSADGNHFRIWVSDDRRPDKIELEGRSRGLQWFFSFYLVFLVEAQKTHKDAILLLDEPGLSLHPLAQEDLSRFFENLANTNQLLYTTHSPFLVDPNHLDRVKAVYIDQNGKTAISANLRANDGVTTRSIYPVHAALNLNVSRTLLQGCTAVLVEGPSDQFYLNAIKIELIRRGLLKLQREIVFVPVGGVRGVAPVTSILVGDGEKLPYVVLDSDKSGVDMATKLEAGLYQHNRDRVITISSITQKPDYEIEDLVEHKVLARILTRQLPRVEDDFDEIINIDSPFVPQVKSFAERYALNLEPGWKVDLAREFKDRLLNNKYKPNDQVVTWWQELFNRINPPS